MIPSSTILAIQTLRQNHPRVQEPPAINRLLSTCEALRAEGTTPSACGTSPKWQKRHLGENREEASTSPK